CIVADARDGPAGIAAMAGRHVLGDGGVLVIAAHAAMGGDAFALEEDLHRADSEAHLHFAACEAVRDAVIVVAYFDVIIDADAADAPFGQDVGIGRQPLQGWPVDLLQKRSARDAEPPDRPFFV